MGIDWNRREFLKAGALVGASRSLPITLQGFGANLRMTPQEFKERLRGPIVSIPTPFTGDFRLDATGLRRMIQMGLDNKITVFELTAGDSQYSYLTYEEIKQLAQLVTATVGNRGMSIIGTDAWWTERTIDFARYAESVGATALQVLKPSGANDDGLIEHYRRIAAETRLPIVLHGDFPMPLLERLAQIDSIVALKEDVSLSYYVDGMIRFGRRINCFSGGGLDWFLVGQPYGATAYFDSYATFVPEIAVRFWQAVQRGDYATEVEIIEKYDHPFIQHFSHSFWHATLEYFGVARRYLRPPQHSYTDAEIAEVKQFYDKLGLSPRKRIA
jgi:dihydrodipicolinate synthase/N-acetylneuraminate lyase